MVSSLDVDINRLIDNLAKKLEDMKIDKPEFVNFVKTGSHAERPPAQKNFWYLRCASILRHAYVQNNVGTNKLRRHYGGRKNKGVQPEKHKPAGGSIIRKAFQSLEKAGLMVKQKTGRTLTPQGVKLLETSAKDVKGNL